jgi:group I intron endonuclease
MITKIYSLQDENGNIRYIGKTGGTLDNRLSAHLKNARCGIKNHCYNWIRSVLSRGKWPSIFLIGEVEGDGCKEEIAWIKYFQDEGINLANQTKGGDGILGYRHTKETLCKLSKATSGEKNPNYGKHHSELTRKKMSEARKKRPSASEETRRKIGEAHKGEKNYNYGKHYYGKENHFFGKHHSEESRRKLGEAHKGLHPSKETKQKMSEATKKRLIENGHPMLGKHHSVETRLKMSKTRTGKRFSEETKTKMSLAQQRRKNKLMSSR